MSRLAMLSCYSGRDEAMFSLLEPFADGEDEFVKRLCALRKLKAEAEKARAEKGL